MYGSWWTDWQAWVTGFSKDQVAARKLGTADVPVLDHAPGSFVAARL